MDRVWTSGAPTGPSEGGDRGDRNFLNQTFKPISSLRRLSSLSWTTFRERRPLGSLTVAGASRAATLGRLSRLTGLLRDPRFMTPRAARVGVALGSSRGNPISLLPPTRPVRSDRAQRGVIITPRAPRRFADKRNVARSCAPLATKSASRLHSPVRASSGRSPTRWLRLVSARRLPVRDTNPFRPPFSRLDISGRERADPSSTPRAIGFAP